MSPDYNSFLRVTKDGRIWWLQKDAIRLGAGFVPVRDDHQTLNAKLQAPNKRVLANEKTLIGAFGDQRLSLKRPVTLDRDGFQYVEAESFLAWLAQYLAWTQTKITFPDELMSKVRIAKAEAAASRPPVAEQDFVSLTGALDDWFEKELDDLPEFLRERVEKEFFPFSWDTLSAEQRRSVAIQHDYQNDPATERDRQYWWDFFVRLDEIKQQITTWENTETPTSSDLALKEERLKALRQELNQMELQLRQRPTDSCLVSIPLEDTNNNDLPATEYIAYPKAMKILREKWQAKPEELAVWILLGTESGGITAYHDANQLSPPPQFGFAYYTGCEDYMSPLMSCWFRQDDIDRFVPNDRYITGAELIDRWSAHPGLQPRAFINAKINESRLIDLHPTFGGTRGTFDEQENFPPLEAGLFAISHIEQIEAEDLDDAPDLSPPPADTGKDVSHKQGGRPKEPLAEAVEKAYLYFLDKGDVAILQPGNIKSFLKELKSLSIDDARPDGFGNEDIREYLSERIKEVKIPRAGKCHIVTQEMEKGKFTINSATYDQEAISRKISNLRRKHPLPT